MPEPLAAPHNVVQVSAAPVTGHAGGQVSVRITVSIQSGWHINSHKPTGADLIPTAVVDKAGDVKLVGVQYPGGVTARFGFSSEPLSVYTGSVAIVATVKLPKDLTVGPHTVKLRIRYQACNDRSCLAPAEATVGVPVTIK